LPYDTKGIENLRKDAVADIVVAEVTPNGTVTERELTTPDALREYIDGILIDEPGGGGNPSTESSYVFIVSGLNSTTIGILGGYLCIPLRVFTHHISGGEVTHRAEGGEAILPYPFNNPSWFSCTWQRLSQYREWAHSIAVQADRWNNHQWVAFKKLSLPSLPIYGSGFETWSIPVAVFREYHAITEVKEKKEWKCAAEERVTFFECELNPKCGWLPPHPSVDFILTLSWNNSQSSFCVTNLGSCTKITTYIRPVPPFPCSKIKIGGNTTPRTYSGSR
jgi:hypothetical protein